MKAHAALIEKSGDDEILVYIRPAAAGGHAWAGSRFLR